MRIQTPQQFFFLNPSSLYTTRRSMQKDEAWTSGTEKGKGRE